MILEEETYESFGYYSYQLSKSSHKKIIRSCDNCGDVKEIKKRDYRNLCQKCSNKNPDLIEKRRKAISGKNHYLYGKEISEETKRKMSIAKRGKMCTDTTKQKMSNSAKKRFKNPKNHPMYGKHLSKETKEKLSNIRKEKKLSMGHSNPNWQGGVSFEPYCIKFNNEFKERIREYFNRCCYVCGKNEIENGQKLSIHHVTYNKETCCDASKPLFVPLCKNCHAKTNGDREYWQEFFTISLEYLTNGECYIKKQE